MEENEATTSMLYYPYVFEGIVGIYPSGNVKVLLHTTAWDML